MSLETEYNRSSKLFEDVVEGEGAEPLETSLEVLRGCIAAVQRASLYSENEELEDVQTGVLKYLYLDYFMGMMLTKVASIEARAASLSAARKSFEIFLSRAHRFKLMHTDEEKAFEMFFPGSTGTEREILSNGADDEEEASSSSSMTRKAAPPSITREMKIAKYKREKECKIRIDYLKKKVRERGQRKLKTGGGDDKDEEAMLAELEVGDEEEELRELYLLQFASYVRGALDEISSIDQEIEILRHMERTRASQPPPMSAAEIEAAARARVPDSVWNDPTKRANILNLPGMPSVPTPIGESKGIEITKTGKGIDGQLLMQKEIVKAGVFKDSIAPPTMSLAEFGDMEKVRFLSSNRSFYCPYIPPSHAFTVTSNVHTSLSINFI